MLNKEEFLAKLEELRDQFKALVPSENDDNEVSETNCESPSDDA